MLEVEIPPILEFVDKLRTAGHSVVELAPNRRSENLLGDLIDSALEYDDEPRRYQKLLRRLGANRAPETKLAARLADDMLHGEPCLPSGIEQALVNREADDPWDSLVSALRRECAARTEPA